MIEKGKELYRRHKAAQKQISLDLARGLTIYKHKQVAEHATAAWMDFCFWNKNLAKEIEAGLI